MCRFLVYKGKEVLLADLITRSKHSLITQSYDSKERPEPLNGDGFGIGWYKPEVDPTPCLFTSITPAWGNRNLHRLAEKITSPCIFAHLRAATGGLLVTEVNCHPFQFERYMWMHNGRIQQFNKVRRKLRESLSDRFYNFISGTTDSEHAFAYFMDQLPLDKRTPTLDDLKEAMLKTIRFLDQLTSEAGITGASKYNFAVTDGVNIVISRYSSNPIETPESLYYSITSEYCCDPEGGEAHLKSGCPHAILVASEPITPDKTKWTAVEANHLLSVGADLEVDITPI